MLLVDKPVGPSSNQVLQRVKWLYQAAKAGHTGTLDPLASGLLPIMFGEATKFAAYLLDAFKVYEATLLLGVTTSTGDAAGEVLERLPVDVSAAEVRTCASTFVGHLTQVPPMHSALKRDGVPLYRLARIGRVVEREPRSIIVDEMQVTRFAPPEIDVRVRCSKGTYIRVLAEDFGKALGCGASLKSLRRIGVANFGIEAAWDLERIERATPAERLAALLPIDVGLTHLPSMHLTREGTERIRLGQSIPCADERAAENALIKLYDIDKSEFIGLGRVTLPNLRPVRLVHASGDENDLRRHRPSR